MNDQLKNNSEKKDYFTEMADALSKYSPEMVTVYGDYFIVRFPDGQALQVSRYFGPCENREDN